MIKLAIIGTNWITKKFVEAALSTGKYQLSAVYSRDKETAEKFANPFGNPAIFTALDELAEANDIDAVYIASPNSMHFPQAKLMLEHHKHVICEKPFTSNIKEAEALVALAKQNEKIVFEAMKTFYLPNYNQIKDYLPKIGKIHKVFLSYCQYSSRYSLYLQGKNPNTFNPKFSNGSIMDIGVYPLNFAIGLWGEPLHIHAEAHLLESGVDAHGSVIMQYDDFEVIICHSKVSDSYLLSEIQGEEGAILIDHLSVTEKIFYRPRAGELTNISLQQNDNDMYYEALTFAELIDNNKIEHRGLKHSLLSAKLLTEIRSQTGVIFPADALK